MAQYDDEIVLKITTNYATAVNEIVRLTNELGKLKADMAGVRQAQKEGAITSDEANKKLEALNAEYRKLNASVRSYRSEIDANLQAEEANAGSLKEMRAQLKNLIKEYDALSQTDREAIGGVGEEKLLEIRRLQEELRQAEEASGRFQRSVGSYEDAIRRALDGTTPMRQAMRELKTEIQTVEFQYAQMGNTIKNRTQELAELGQAVGTDTEDYRQQAAELEALKQQYDQTGKSLNDMKVAAGQMDDAMKDASQSIANFGADNANLKAMTQGAQLLLNGYTALKAGMTALGIESEELINVFSKIQILQQGLNAVNQISIMLEKQSILSQQARLLWTKLTTTSIATLTAAKKKDAVASAEAAAGDTALAAGEVAATAAAGGLTKALRAVGAAIKSIPIIGWILAAVAALATLTTLIVRASKASKENNSTLKERIAFQKELLDLEKQSLEAVKSQEVQLRANVARVKELEAGTDEWKRGVKDVADGLGVDAEWLQKNIDKVDDLTDAWVRMKVAMAKGEAYGKSIAENEIKIAQAQARIDAIMASTDPKKRVDALKEELGMTERMAKKINEAYHRSRKEGTTEALVKYYNAVNEYTASLEKQNEVLKDGLEDSLDEAAEAGKTLDDGIKAAGKTAETTASNASKAIKKTTKELTEELEDLMVEGMADGLEKQIKQVEVAAERYIEKMKEARDKDAKNKEKYDEIILQYEKNTQAKIAKMRDEGYKQIIEGAHKIGESYDKLWASYAPNSFYNFVNDIKATVKAVSKEVTDMNNDIRKLEMQINAYRKTSDAFSKYAKTRNDTESASGEQAKDDEKAAESKERLTEATDGLAKAEKELAEIEEKWQSKFAENIIINRKVGKSLQEYAKTIQQVILEQAKLGNISIIPDDFQAFIDYQIDKLEEEMAKSYNRLERMAPKLGTSGATGEFVEDYMREAEQYQAMKQKLEELRETRKSVSEDLVKSGATGGFFDNDELIQNEMNIQRVTNQINVMQQVLQQGTEMDSEITKLQEANDKLYVDRLNAIAQLGAAATEEEKAEKQAALDRIDQQIEANNELINSFKESMALMGYTTDEEIKRMIDGLNQQLNAFSKNTGVIMKKTVSSVMQSIGTMMNSLSDLMNEIGEDNAEMANFLEGVAYVQIGVNMAVGIAEAIAAGAGVAFPANLAAIAAGVAAVVSGIASAISTYKKYHQDISSPKFATGGYVSGEKGVDRVPAWLSDGEYVIRRKRVQELGVPFLDALNQGRSIVGRTHFADGGYVASSRATQMMVNEDSRQMLIDAIGEIQPIVSVREITNVQNKVKAKEITARR